MHMLSTLPGEAVPAPFMPWSAEVFSLAAGSDVNDRKPHQGVTGKNPGLHQGAMACKSTAALGVSWRLSAGTASGATVTYDYDAFGNSFTVTGSTPNNYLYRGEQFDADLGLYYFRARYYNPLTGRFMSRDPENGRAKYPASLHKYLYALGDPGNRIDPTGRDSMLEVGDLDVFIGRSAVPALAEFVGGTAVSIAEWTIAVQVAAEEITGYLTEVAAEEAAGQSAAAWNSLLAAINEFNALLADESLWGGVTRLLLCTDIGLVGGQIAEYTGILSPKGAHIYEATSIFGCGLFFEIKTRM